MKKFLTFCVVNQTLGALPLSTEEDIQQNVTPHSFSFSHGGKPTGLTGFEAGVGVRYQSILDQEAESHLFAPYLNFQKGVPFLDVFAETDLSAEVESRLGLGAQLSVLNLPALPVLSLRGGWVTHLSETLDSNIFSGEVVTSWALPPGASFVEPFLAVGWAYYQITTQEDYSWSDLYGNVGVRVVLLPFLGITAQARLSSIVQSYLLKLSFRF